MSMLKKMKLKFFITFEKKKYIYIFFFQLPDVANTFVTISRLLGDHESFDSIQKRVLEGQKNFNNIKYEISESLKDVKPDFIRGFETTGKNYQD